MRVPPGSKFRYHALLGEEGVGARAPRTDRSAEHARGFGVDPADPPPHRRGSARHLGATRRAREPGIRRRPRADHLHRPPTSLSPLFSNAFTVDKSIITPYHASYAGLRPSVPEMTRLRGPARCSGSQRRSGWWRLVLVPGVCSRRASSPARSTQRPTSGPVIRESPGPPTSRRWSCSSTPSAPARARRSTSSRRCSRSRPSST